MTCLTVMIYAHADEILGQFMIIAGTFFCCRYILCCSSLVKTLIDATNYHLDSNGKEACKNNSGRIAESSSSGNPTNSWYVLVSTLFALRSCLHSHSNFQPCIAAMGFEHA